MPDPIIPTRIIPGGVPLPSGPPPAGAVPPWRAPAPAAPPPPPPVVPPAVAVPAPTPPPPDPQIHVHVVMAYEPEPEPTRWQRLWSWATSIGRPWQICGALTLALLPIPGVGYSVATIWASLVTEARAEYGQANAYALALTPLAIAVMRIVRGGGTLRRLLLLAIGLVGLMGAIDLYDPITWLTGVDPS
ncbi:hypothetical protein [Streptomyces anulatus]|uniref:hypothetical protein n=1 Tax=Streptomyces anulatus TaxID=1892 RepID=UPI00070EEB65|nr:hypothetical protein [Streptomyces anulatus]